MKSKIKTGRRFLVSLIFGFLLCSVCLGGFGITARAAEQSFIVDAELLPSGKDTYDIRLIVGNLGQNWEGTVRLTLEGNYGYFYACAYDTALSLPQDSTKQFVVRVPKESMDRANGTVKVVLLDKKGNKLAEDSFKRLLEEETDALSMGILSDDYPALTYLDMGGEELYFSGDDFPIRLVELNQDNLADSLDSLTFLVIDRYDTSVLTDEEIKSVELWTTAGGVLLVGTGSYARDTLGGLDYLGVSCDEIHEPDENTNLQEGFVDWSLLPLAELEEGSWGHSEQYDSLAWVFAMGDGAVGVLPYSLWELGRLDTSAYENSGLTQEMFVYYILDGVSSNAGSRYSSHSYSSKYDSAYMLRRLLRSLGNSNDALHLGVLKIIVIAYVIFVGPVLYLILRFLKKRDLYWVAVPVTALLGIILVFLAGRGFEVVGTRIYSVAVQNLSESGKENSKTYLHCYDADHDEWELRLAEGYEYVGPLDCGYDYNDEGTYYHHIRKEGDRLFFGIKPTTSFEDSFFCAGVTGNGKVQNGRIVSDIVVDSWTGVTGTVTNETDWNFAYLAVLADGTLYVYGKLPAGESCDLQDRRVLYSNSLDYNFVYSYMNTLSEESDGEGADADIIAALGVGICSACSRIDENTTVVVGVTADWARAVDDNGSEISYGCLYAVQ